MAIVTTLGRKVNVLSGTYEAAVDLSDLQFCAVVASGASTGKVKIAAPAAQGALSMGILQTYDCDAAEQGEVLEEGISKAVADSTFDSGVELTPSGTDGKLEGASGADYVIAIALEAATAADQQVTVRVVSPYQKNA